MEEFPKLMLRDTVFVILRNFNLIYLSVDKVIIGEGNGTPLQYFCLENPRDGGAW